MMDMSPQKSIQFVSLDEILNKKQSDFNLRPTFTNYSFGEYITYSIIVESWEKKKYGRIKRSYLQKFDEKERQKLTKIAAKLYKWYFISGTPKNVQLSIGTIQLLQKAVDFFATV